MKYARVIDGAVIETVTLPDDVFPDDIYVPDVAGEFRKAGAAVEPGWLFDGTTYSQPPQQNGGTLDAIKQALKASIDAAAETARGAYITPGAGQAMTYTRKADEARRLVASGEGDPDPADYPMLAASLGIDGETLAEVAELVLQMDAQWAVIGAAIESVRLTAKRDVDMANTAEEAHVVFAAVVWPQA